MIKLDDLFKKYGICLKNYNIDELLSKFIEEMNLGLENKDSSLAMINSYITPSLNWENETVAVIDAGGTNLRIGLAALDAEGKINLYDFIDEIQDFPKKGIIFKVAIKSFFARS